MNLCCQEIAFDANVTKYGVGSFPDLSLTEQK
jgi:hypothetical protein